MSKCDGNGMLNWISIIQAISTLLIVFSHSVVVGIDYPVYFPEIIRSVQLIGLTAFMWCSGYLLVRTNSIEKYGFKKYIVKRFIRLMIPFFIVQLLILLPKFILAKYSGNPLNISLVGILYSFIIPREGILPHLWFLPTLMLLCLVSPVLIKLSKHHIGIILGLVVSFILTFIPPLPNILCVNDVVHYLFWYYLGICAASLIKESDLQSTNPTIYILIALISLIVYSVITITTNDFAFSEPLKSLFSLLLLVSVTLLVNKNISFSKHTFPVYILSLPVQNVLEIILRKFQINWRLSTLSMFIIGVIIPMFISVVISQIEKNRRHKPLSKIIGL